MPADWRDNAACKGENPDVFFSERGDMAGVAAALNICAPCPVRDACLEDALTHGAGNDQGIRGGMTGKERRDLRQQRARRQAS